MFNMKPTNIHSGHRQRLKSKVKNNGLKSLSMHEVLELMLTYTIPQRDTNELAHNLIKKYNGFAGVFDADHSDLINNNQVGEETALFLSMLPDFVDIYLQEKNKNFVLNNVYSCVQFFRKNFIMHNEEVLFITCLGKTGKVLKTVEIKGSNDCEIDFDLKQIGQIINVQNIFAIVLFHTHPNGSVTPSLEDYETTQRIINICAMMNIYVADHIILNENDHYSFGRNNLIADMYKKHNALFPKDSINLEILKKLGILFN